MRRQPITGQRKNISQVSDLSSVAAVKVLEAHSVVGLVGVFFLILWDIAGVEGI